MVDASQNTHLQQQAETLDNAGHLTKKEREDPGQYHKQRFLKAFLEHEKAGIFDHTYR